MCDWSSDVFSSDLVVVLVDQRGTCKSNPLQCEGLADADMPADEAAMLDAMRTAVERCRDELSQRADLHFYTPTDAVRDPDAVRQAIGAYQITLLGLYYCTRVAPQYAPPYPPPPPTIQRTRVGVG